MTSLLTVKTISIELYGEDNNIKLLFWRSCSTIRSCMEQKPVSPVCYQPGYDIICGTNALKFKAWKTSFFNGTVMALWSIHLQKSLTQLFLCDITAVPSLQRQKGRHAHQHKHWQTHTYTLVCSKYGIPEVARTGWTYADPEGDRGVHSGG